MEDWLELGSVESLELVSCVLLELVEEGLLEIEAWEEEFFSCSCPPQAENSREKPGQRRRVF